MENTEELRDQIDREAKNSLAETMWGKPANDIITGISNNSAVPANRAIWELVQNARDVSKIGGKAEICFIRKENEFIFRHNGQPFDNKSILALILQTSSKVRNDIVKVGQYGTGFLTTHKFGLKFQLEGSLKVASDKELYYNFGKDSTFEIDRSFRDKKAMIQSIQKQVEKKEAWIANLEKLSSSPSEETVFTYLHEHDIERENVKEAFEKSPILAPYVLALNPLVGKITFQDEIIGTCCSYFTEDRKIEWENDSILVEQVTIQCENGNKLCLYLLKSKTQIDKATQESKVTVILPWNKVNDIISYNELNEHFPQLYLYLPLLGTENWGWNYIVHAPAFTCDKDTRDSLLFVGNGQNNDDQAEQNRTLVDLAGKLIQEYLAAKMTEIPNRKFLGRVNFLPAPKESLKPYYGTLQNEWVKYFEQQPLVKHGDSYINVSRIRTLDNELYKACEKDSALLDAFYSLLSKSIHTLTLPEKDEFIHWSRYVDEWYEGKVNTHTITLKDICDKIKCTPLVAEDMVWLHKICQYLKDHPRSEIALKSIVPNENLKLVETDLVRPIKFTETFRSVMKILIPAEVDKFVHADFLDIMIDAEEYGYDKAKTALTSFTTSLKNGYSTLKSAIISNTYWRRSDYENMYLKDSVSHALLDLYKMLIPSDGSGFTSKIYNLLTEFYGYSTDTQDRIDKDCFDVRNCYTALINDSLLQFTLLEDKTAKADWVLRVVKELFGFTEAQSFLRNYMVYPDQTGKYRYSSQLKKQQNMPERLKEMYNEICSKNVQAELVAENFQNYFVETGLLNGQTLADSIKKPFVDNDNYSIAKNPKQNLFIEIIEKFSDPKDGSVWVALFSDFNSHKADMLLSAMNSTEKRESIFTLMKVQDTGRLKKMAELSGRDDFDRIMQLGMAARDQELREQNDFDFKEKLGSYVEDYLQEQLKDILGNNELTVTIINEQGGQDLKVKVNGEVVYYIEVKSRWASDQSVLMSTMQHQTSYREKQHYALCAVDMSQYDRNLAVQHIYPEVDKIKDKISAITNIGNLNERLKDAVEEEEVDKVHIAGGYQVLVSQNVIKENGISFDEFVNQLKEIIAEKIAW